MGEYELEYMNVFVSTTNVEFSFKLRQPYRNSMNVNHCYNIIEWKKMEKRDKKKEAEKKAEC